MAPGLHGEPENHLVVRLNTGPVDPGNSPKEVCLLER